MCDVSISKRANRLRAAHVPVCLFYSSQTRFINDSLAKVITHSRFKYISWLNQHVYKNMILFMCICFFGRRLQLKYCYYFPVRGHVSMHYSIQPLTLWRKLCQCSENYSLHTHLLSQSKSFHPLSPGLGKVSSILLKVLKSGNYLIFEVKIFNISL